jgi:hypothetical protein
MAFSTSAAVRASLIPAEVSSCRIGATIISGYMKFLPLFIQFYQADLDLPNSSISVLSVNQW